VILDIHDILPEFYVSKFGGSSNSLSFKALVLLEKLSIFVSDHVIIANHLWQQKLLSRSVGAEKCTTIVNYPDTRLFYPRRKVRDDEKFHLIYPGSLNAHQGLDLAIRAFAKVATRMGNAEFHIYGDGPSKQALIELSAKLGLVDRVIFHDFLPTSQIAEIMADSDLAVVPKKASSSFGNEAASTKIMEFMAVGVPVIVSRTRIDTYYHDSSRVKFFESDDESDLAACMLLLWSDRNLRQSLVSNGTRYVSDHSWEKDRQEYLRLIDSMVVPAHTAAQKWQTQK
jgi:glycosyltransferase involved in cell wall biosynthesis